MERTNARGRKQGCFIETHVEKKRKKKFEYGCTSRYFFTRVLDDRACIRLPYYTYDIRTHNSSNHVSQICTSFMFTFGKFDDF